MVHGGDWVDRLLGAFNGHNAAAVAEFMTEDVEYMDWDGDRWATVRGRDRVVARLNSFDEDFSSDFTLSKTFAVVTETGFAIEYTEDGTQDRGESPTGRRFSLHNVMVGELRSGMISRLTDYSDVVAYRQQMSTGRAEE